MLMVKIILLIQGRKPCAPTVNLLLPGNFNLRKSPKPLTNDLGLPYQVK